MIWLYNINNTLIFKLVIMSILNNPIIVYSKGTSNERTAERRKVQKMEKSDYVWIGVFIISVILAISFIIFYFHVLNEYKNVPVSEMPVWVWWLLGGNKK